VSGFGGKERRLWKTQHSRSRDSRRTEGGQDDGKVAAGFSQQQQQQGAPKRETAAIDDSRVPKAQNLDHFDSGTSHILDGTSFPSVMLGLALYA
jgi:hypothetical protein